MLPNTCFLTIQLQKSWTQTSILSVTWTRWQCSFEVARWKYSSKLFFEVKLDVLLVNWIFFFKLNDLVIDVSCIIPSEILESFCVFHLKSFNFLKELLKIFLFRAVFYIIIFQNFIFYFFKTILADLFSIDIVIGL